MNTSSEKRRGGAGGHVLRAGTPSQRSSIVNTPNARNSISGNAQTQGQSSGGLPAVPPKVAMTSSNMSSSPEETIDGGPGGSTVAEKDKERERDGSSSQTAVSQSASSKSKKRESSIMGGAATANHHRSVSKDRDLATQLREREERIVFLEREMAVMEREFQKELDRFSANESETATFWQGKHSALNQQFLRTDTELRLLRAEVDLREGEREELRRGWEMMRRELRERDEEVKRLRSQIRGLKEFVSTSTRTDGQTSDEVFGDGMTKLCNGLQNWVIVHFRKAKLSLDKANEATLAELSELVPTYEDLQHSYKVHMLQSLVSRILVEMIFDSYYVGLSEEQTKQFRQMEETLSKFSSSPEPMNQWRSSTLALLRREAADSLHGSTSSFTETVLSRINRLLSSITTEPLSPNESRDSALRVLINNSIGLSRLLVVQKAVLKVYMPHVLPHQAVPFEAETMEDIGGEDEDALARREISCVVFPGVIKRGDESGGQLQFRNVLAKAKVLCSPGQD